MMDKKELRKYIAARKAELTPDVRQAEEKAVWAALESMEEFMSASSILVYSSLPDEVSTSDFIGRWHGRKRMVLPLVSGESLVLKEYVPGRTHEGYKSILEPDEDLPDIAPEDIGFAIIPGVGFAPDGRRLGRGKGFYDRLLPALRCPVVGVAYRCQIAGDLPSDPWDIPVSAVITA